MLNEGLNLDFLIRPIGHDPVSTVCDFRPYEMADLKDKDGFRLDFGDFVYYDSGNNHDFIIMELVKAPESYHTGNFDADGNPEYLQYWVTGLATRYRDGDSGPLEFMLERWMLTERPQFNRLNSCTRIGRLREPHEDPLRRQKVIPPMPTDEEFLNLFIWWA